ncbi:DUF4268 domain-containing protein [Flavihumibacter fluvii]|uniref:DUF4268 domain-containing protein n=1 Tax=Flavihumibacter fluvii TaxID=2838157 RepID=UPI001BDE8BAF|nr:DUF4268 domain-containing protein [Flavihumibacter fluvii]ULQ53733.1 DUF4268 domain-containing protein [Flavihumibacter fluvii]
MFPKLPASLIRTRFFTAFGQYMAPVPSASGDPVNWMNYKTGVKPVFFRLETPNRGAEIGFLIQHPDQHLRFRLYNLFLDFQPQFEEMIGHDWTWSRQISSGEGQIVSRIYDRIDNVSVLDHKDWPALISFFKPRLLAMDAFWWLVKDQFE